MAHKNLIEGVINSIDDSQLLHQLGIPNASNGRSEFWHVAYSSKGNSPVILFGSTIQHDSLNDCSCTFADYLLRAHAPNTVNEAATLISTYSAAHPWLWPSRPADQLTIERYLEIGSGLKPCYKSDQIVDQILSESRGLLLWNDQLERLISAFIARPSERVKLRKRINAKHVDAWIAIHKMLFPSGISLAGVISERTIENCIRPYQLRPAITLCDIAYGLTPDK